MHLFSPITFRGVTLKNRVVVSPMCQYSSEDGFATDWHLVHLGSRAVGGAALVFTEAAAVEAAGRISPNDLGIYSDEHVGMLKRITSFIHGLGGATGVQLAHAGRKASTARPWEGGKPVLPEQGGWTELSAPSALAFADGYQVPHELARDEIAKIVKAFGEATRRADEAGFDVVELHAAHGYLLHQFLSPISNKRTDGYGGTIANRARFLTEIIEAVRKVWPENKPIFVRISSTEWVDDGFGIEDSIVLAKILKAHGVDLVDCSSGGNVPKADIPTGPGYQTIFAERIRKEAELPTAAVGMITDAVQADHIVRTEQADLVFLAREMLRDPYFANRAARQLGHPGSVPPQYGRA